MARKICEDISVSFLMDDASATSISISDPKVSYTIDVYEQKLNDWEERLPQDLEVRQLMFFKEVTVLYLHEIALQSVSMLPVMDANANSRIVSITTSMTLGCPSPKTVSDRVSNTPRL